MSFTCWQRQQNGKNTFEATSGLYLCSNLQLKGTIEQRPVTWTPILLLAAFLTSAHLNSFKIQTSPQLSQDPSSRDNMWPMYSLRCCVFAEVEEVYVERATKSTTLPSKLVSLTHDLERSCRDSHLYVERGHQHRLDHFRRQTLHFWWFKDFFILLWPHCCCGWETHTRQHRFGLV